MRIDIDGIRKRAPTAESFLLWIGPALLAIGFVAERMWKSFPAPRALETLTMAALALGFAWILSRVMRAAMATAVAVVFLLALTYFAGVAPVVSVLLLCASAFVVGSWITGNESALLATVAGIAVFAGAIGWLLPFPIHYRLVYFLLLLAPVVAGRQQLTIAVRKLSSEWRSATAGSPRLATFAVLVFGLASAGCWLPTVQYDDLAYHLGLPSQLAEFHYYRMDVQSQIWALAPWSGDIVQAIARMVAGAEARGAVDALWLCLIGGLTWRLAASLSAPNYACWLTVAVVASQPLLTSLAGGMQAELPATAATLALALCVATVSLRANLRETLCFALVAALLIGLKTGFAAIVVPLSVWLCWRWRGQWTFRFVFIAFATFVAACASSYVYAGLITADPFFPLFIKVFDARLRPDVLTDTRWAASVGWNIPWQLTFDTSSYHEGWNGAAGFSMLGLLGAIVMALFVKPTRALAVCGVITFIAAIATVHYFRYTFPALTMLTVVAIAFVASITSPRKTAVLCMALVALNLAYQSCASWTLHVGGIKRQLIDSSSQIDRFAPERTLIQDARQENPSAIILVCSPDRPFVAELAGRGFTTSHYDPELDRLRIAADADPSGAAWRAIFDRTNAQYAIVSTREPHNAALDAALSDARRVREIGSAQLWMLPERKNTVDDLMNTRDFARRKFWP